MSPQRASESARSPRRDVLENHERILNAARELFRERGLNVTIHDLMAKAKLGIGTFYRHFPNRDALLDELFEESIGRLLALARDALTYVDPWEGIVQFLEQGLDMMMEDRGLWKLAVRGSQNGHLFYGAPGFVRGPFDEYMGELFGRAQATGHLRSDIDPADLPVLHVMLGAVTDLTSGIDPDAASRYLAIILDGLRSTRVDPSPLPHDALQPRELNTALQRWYGFSN